MKDSRLMFTEGELPPEEENSAVDAVDAGTRITELSVWKTREDIQHRQKQAEKHKAESNPESKQNQRRVMKKRYSRRHGEEAERTAERTAEAAEKAARAAEEAAEKAAEFIKEHWKGIAIVGAIALLLVFLTSVFSTCSVFVSGVGGVVSESGYAATDEDILSGEEAYLALEENLRETLAAYETNGVYDEILYDLDEIGHDPYALISIVSAVYPDGWTLAQAQATLETIFWKQYRMGENVLYETRYRPVSIPDPPYTVQQPYHYTICTVSLRNHDLTEVAEAYLTPEQYERFEMYMETHGLRPDLFPETAAP